jgi:hypothetical protein
MIHTILDAIEIILEDQGESQSPFWLASQMLEIGLRRASEHDLRAALEQDFKEFGRRSQFVGTADGEYALRRWTKS